MAYFLVTRLWSYQNNNKSVFRMPGDLHDFSKIIEFKCIVWKRKFRNSKNLQIQMSVSSRRCMSIWYYIYFKITGCVYKVMQMILS